MTRMKGQRVSYIYFCFVYDSESLKDMCMSNIQNVLGSLIETYNKNEA